MNDLPILITGATGFLGGFLAGELIKRGRRTILIVRPKGNDSPHRRVRHLLDFLEVKPQHEPVVIAAEIDQPGLALSAAHRKILARVPQVLHCAADTSFSARRSAQTEATNLHGLRNVFAAVPACSRFFHMSTAYVAGVQEGLIAEKLQAPARFHNPYERSKHAAERLIVELCAERGTELAIFRPTITYGHSRTGKSLRFNALYYPVRTLLFLRDTLKNDILLRDGKRAGGLGVSLAQDGSVNLPLTLPGADAGGLNLIPVDFLVEAVIAIIESGTTGIFNIANPQTSTVTELAGNLHRFYSLSGLEVSAARVAGGPLQTLINSCMEVYYPYFCDRRRFSVSRAGAILDPLGIQCPHLSPAVFKLCMDYAIHADWGQISAGVPPAA